MKFIILPDHKKIKVKLELNILKRTFLISTIITF